MMQQVNLYQIEEPIEPVVLTFIHMAQITAGFAIILLLISCFQVAAYCSARIESASLTQQQNKLTLNLEKTKGQEPALEEIKQIEHKISVLETTVTDMKKMQQILTLVKKGETLGFSAYLSALARYNVPEIWLTVIKMSLGGELIYLEGKTLSAENVPKLLQKLGKDSAFAGKTFEAFKLYTAEKEQLIKFIIGSNDG